VEHFARQAIPHLAVSEQPRSRIRNRDAFRKAAEYQARAPKVSWNVLADAVGVSQSTVRQWSQFPEFARHVADARFHIQLDIDSEQHREKLQQFGRWIGKYIKNSHRR
jgi:hypothetical protein